MKYPHQKNLYKKIFLYKMFHSCYYYTIKVFMSISITSYNSICNLGDNIDEIFSQALAGNSSKFEICSDIIKGKKVRLGRIYSKLPKIEDTDYDIRCNQLILACLNLLKPQINNLIKEYGVDNIGVVVGTTNTGVEEFEKSNNYKHSEIGNPAQFIKKYLKLKNYYASVSTACSSGIKAFSLARDLITSGISKAVIVVGSDGISKLSVFGFNSLEILTEEITNPFSKNRLAMNIGEGVGVFILEKDKSGIEIAGFGETTDTYHATCPEPEATEEIKAINLALKEAQITPQEVDYINLHGTGTISNDTMEANAIYKIFGDKVWASSTKPLTGHCLGAASSVETALCCRLLEKGNKKLYPHIYDGIYDKKLPKIKLVPKNCEAERLNTILSLAFGFGGTNAAIILRRNHFEKL